MQIAGRALVYGFARMNIDGHFSRWGVDEAEAERTAEAILDLFIGGIARRSTGGAVPGSFSGTCGWTDRRGNDRGAVGVLPVWFVLAP